MPIQDYKISKKLDPNKPGRQVELRAWIILNGYTMGQLARILGVHPSMMTRIVSGDRAPAKRIRQLEELGVPKELLPEPSRPPGRPPKKQPA